MPFRTWVRRFLRQASGVNPFQGDVLPSRVSLFGFGRPSLPFPHLWNYREPLRILETYFCNVEGQSGSGKHNRYFDVPGLDHVLVTREPAVIRAILSATGDQPGEFDRDTAPTAGIGRETGKDSLLYANGALWRRQKLIAAAPFSRTTLFQPEKFGEFERTFRTTVRDRLDYLRARLKDKGSPVGRTALEPEIGVVMLQMLVNNFFGGSVSYEELRDRYRPAILGLIDHMVQDTVGRRLLAPLKWISGQASRLKRWRADFEALTDLALSGRADRRALWAHFKSDVPDAALRSNIRVFLAGALEATTSFASWALSHLARAPEIQERVHGEVMDMNEYDPENLAQAVTLNRVLEETLRLTPSLYFLPRRATVDTWVDVPVGRKLWIPRGTHIVLDVWHANRCDDFWGTEASGFPAGTFAPDRWEVLARKGRGPKDILHFGFGYGPRICPGKFLGLLEVGLVVGAFVKIFKFAAVNPEVEARAGVSTKPADGVLVDLQIR